MSQARKKIEMIDIKPSNLHQMLKLSPLIDKERAKYFLDMLEDSKLSQDICLEPTVLYNFNIILSLVKRLERDGLVTEANLELLKEYVKNPSSKTQRIANPDQSSEKIEINIFEILYFMDLVRKICGKLTQLDFEVMMGKSVGYSSDEVASVATIAVGIVDQLIEQFCIFEYYTTPEGGRVFHFNGIDTNAYWPAVHYGWIFDQQKRNEFYLWLREVIKNNPCYFSMSSYNLTVLQLICIYADVISFSNHHSQSMRMKIKNCIAKNLNYAVDKIEFFRVLVVRKFEPDDIFYIFNKIEILHAKYPLSEPSIVSREWYGNYFLDLIRRDKEAKCDEYNYRCNIDILRDSKNINLIFLMRLEKWAQLFKNISQKYYAEPDWFVRDHSEFYSIARQYLKPEILSQVSFFSGLHNRTGAKSVLMKLQKQSSIFNNNVFSRVFSLAGLKEPNEVVVQASSSSPSL